MMSEHMDTAAERAATAQLRSEAHWAQAYPLAQRLIAAGALTERQIRMLTRHRAAWRAASYGFDMATARRLAFARYLMREGHLKE